MGQICIEHSSSYCAAILHLIRNVDADSPWSRRMCLCCAVEYEGLSYQIVHFIGMSICIYPCVSLRDYCCHSIFRVLFSSLITPLSLPPKALTISTYPISPFPPLFSFINPVPTPNPFSSLFPSRPSFHSSFSSRFHLRRFTLNARSVDRWGFPTVLSRTSRMKYGCMCVFADVCVPCVYMYMYMCVPLYLLTCLCVTLCAFLRSYTVFLCRWGHFDTHSLPSVS